MNIPKHHDHHAQRTDLPINRFRQGKGDSSNNWPDPINNLPGEEDINPAGPAVDNNAAEMEHLKSIGKDPEHALAQQREAEAHAAARQKALQEAVPEGDLASMAAEDHLHSMQPEQSKVYHRRPHQRARQEAGTAEERAPVMESTPAHSPGGRASGVPGTGRGGPGGSHCVVG